MPDVACKLVDNGNLPRTGCAPAIHLYVREVEAYGVRTLFDESTAAVRTSLDVCRYSFAVTGITMTAIALQLLRNGALKWDLYALAEAPALSHFHDVYCARPASPPALH